MAEHLRFHFDEHIDPGIALALRRNGIDVTTTIEAGLRTKRDEAHLEHARQQRRVIVTNDADFLRLVSNSTDHPGIAYCNISARSIGEIIDTLLMMYEVLSPEEMIGRVEYL